MRRAFGLLCLALAVACALLLVHEGLRASGIIQDRTQTDDGPCGQWLEMERAENAERERAERGGLSAREYREEDATHE